MSSDAVEERWLDALDALESGNRQEYGEIAAEVVKSDPDHVGALWALVETSLPPIARNGRRMGDIDLGTAAKAFSRCKRIVANDPDHISAWITGGSLLTVDLGMFESALDWWEQRRAIAYNELMPLVEQVGILTRFGLYEEAAERLEKLFSSGMEEPNPQQMMRLEKMYQEVKLAANDDQKQFFRPQEPKHVGWNRIKAFKHRKPTTPTYWLIFVVLPFLWIEAIVWNRVIGTPTLFTTIGGFLIIFISFLYGSRLTHTLTRKINRPAQHLERAMDVESTSGKVCIPIELRLSKLGKALTSKRTASFRDRHAMIIADGDKLPLSWRLQIPDWIDESE